jgi:hypothetical protein
MDVQVKIFLILKIQTYTVKTHLMGYWSSSLSPECRNFNEISLNSNDALLNSDNRVCFRK